MKKHPRMLIVLTLVIAYGAFQGNPLQAQEDDAYYRAALASLDVIYADKPAPPQDWQQKLFPKPSGTPKISWYQKLGDFHLTFLVASDNDTVILAIRGTDSNDKANTDMNAEVDMDALKKGDLRQVGVVLNGVPDLYKHKGFEGVIAHQGWARGVNSIVDTIARELAQHDAPKKRIIVTGHSMGGAMSYYLPFRLLTGSSTAELFAYDKPHRIFAFAAPRVGAEFKSSYGKSFRAKLTKAAYARSRLFGIYSIENVGSNNVPDSVTTVWQDKVQQYLKGWPVNFSRVGVPIDFKLAIKEENDNRALHSSTLYLDGVRRTRNVPLPPPMGWVEFFCEGGYVAECKLTYVADGKEVARETNLAIGMIEFFDVPGNATNVKVSAKAALGVGIFSRDFNGPPNRHFKMYNTSLDPVWVQLEGPQEYEVKVKTKKNRTAFDGYGTDSNISLEMIGTHGSTQPLKLNHLLSGNIFESDQLNTFQVFDTYVGEIKSIVVHHAGDYPGAAWTPEYLEITPKRGKPVRFNINRELSKGAHPFK